MVVGGDGGHDTIHRRAIRYLIGWQLGHDTFSTLRLSETPDATDVFVSWCTMAEVRRFGQRGAKRWRQRVIDWYQPW